MRILLLSVCFFCFCFIDHYFLLRFSFLLMTDLRSFKQPPEIFSFFLFSFFLFQSFSTNLIRPNGKDAEAMSVGFVEKKFLINSLFCFLYQKRNTFLWARWETIMGNSLLESTNQPTNPSCADGEKQKSSYFHSTKTNRLKSKQEVNNNQTLLY